MSKHSSSKNTLRDNLDYEPQVLQFGTSGRRGKVLHLTQLEIYINALAELEYLQSLPAALGGIRRDDEFYFAYDLRPSSTCYVAEQEGRGEIAQAIERAIKDAGMRPINLDKIPTPALASYALERGKASMMITGSHIPNEWNGYKTYSSTGELLKKDEIPINIRAEQIRDRIYNQPYEGSYFDRRGNFKHGPCKLSPLNHAGRNAYITRYLDFFAHKNLVGKRILVYQHSAVGSEILVEILTMFGAEVYSTDRTTNFVAIDTESIDKEQLKVIQELGNKYSAEHGPFDAIVSTDGDSDRPLVLFLEKSTFDVKCTGRIRFFGGDLLGIIVAEYLNASDVVVPINTSDAVDRCSLMDRVKPKTRIGSPYVIEGMQKVIQGGGEIVCGWEANGGFFTGSDIVSPCGVLKALPTRDAVLPILCLLFSMQDKNCSMVERFSLLPKRFSHSVRLKNYPKAKGQQVVRWFSPDNKAIREVAFHGDGITILDDKGPKLALDTDIKQMRSIRELLASVFKPKIGFNEIARINYTDGTRISFCNRDVVHLRPSGNADEFRIYIVADTQDRAEEIARLGTDEHNGILQKLERAI